MNRRPTNVRTSVPLIVCDRTADLLVGTATARCTTTLTTPFKPGWHSRGYIPHCDANGMIQHITFHQRDSLPKAALEHFEYTIADLPENEKKRRKLLKYHTLLDAGYGTCVLRLPEAARIVQNALLHFDGERYRLLAWVVMPNHVHALVESVDGFLLARIVQSWKSFTARRINEWVEEVGECRAGARRSTGPQSRGFWQRDYWDRYIRNDDHYHTVVRYIEENPVKAGLATAAQNWPWSSAHR